MFDARTLDEGTKLGCDVCIIGSGPAGASLAVALSNSSLRVIVLEAGGDARVDTESGDMSKDSQFGNAQSVMNARAFGGNGNMWNIHTDLSSRSVRFAIPQAAEFAERTLPDNAAWPFAYDELLPFIEKAARLWKIDPTGFSPTAGDTTVDCGPDVETGVFQFPQSEQLRNTFRATLEAADNVSIYSNAVADTLIPAKDGKRHTANIITTDGKRFIVESQHIVLASGCMGNCRILLSSQIGNSSGQLGRNFMDHPLLNGGMLVPNDPKVFDRMALYDMQCKDGVVKMGYLRLNDAALIKHNAPALSAVLFPRKRKALEAPERTQREQRAHQAALSVRGAISRKELPRPKDILVALSGVDEVVRRLIKRRIAPDSNLGRGGWSKTHQPSAKYDVFEVFQQAEQFIYAENKLVLSKEFDALGLPRIKVDWRLHDEDIDALAESQKRMADSIKSSGFGEIIPPDQTGRPRIISSSTGHHMGATRMGTDATRSIVDPNCQLHDVDNIYALSTGVFPVGGFANPTFLVSTLALRLADHLLKT